jgi:co-chaperonin GroES (HSP10)
MNLRPLNKYVVVKPLEKKREQSSFALPSNFNVPNNNVMGLTLVQILAISPDSEIQINVGSVAVVDIAMVQRLEWEGEVVHVVKDYQLIASLDEE